MGRRPGQYPGSTNPDVEVSSSKNDTGEDTFRSVRSIVEEFAIGRSLKRSDRWQSHRPTTLALRIARADVHMGKMSKCVQDQGPVAIVPARSVTALRSRVDEEGLHLERGLDGIFSAHNE